MAAENVLQKIIGLILLIVVFLILAFAYYSREGFIPKLADKVLSLEKYIPVKLSKKLETSKTVPDDVIKAHAGFKTAVESYLTQKTDTPCLVSMPNIAISDLGLELSNLEGKSKSRVIRETPDGYVALSVIDIEKANFCLVEPGNLYKCINEGQCSNLQRDAAIIRVFNSKIKIGEKDYSTAPYLLKTDDDSLCFIPLHRVGNIFKKCDYTDVSIDNGCTSMMAANLKKCSQIRQPVFFQGTFYGNKNEWKFAEGAYYFAGTDNRVPFMFRIGAKDVSLGRKGLVEAEFNNVFSSGTQQEPQKDGVYYEDNFYGRKEDWKFVNLGFISGKKWVYKGTDAEVQPSMKTTGLSIEEKLRLFGPPGEE